MRSKRYWFLPLCLFVAVMVLTSSVSYAADDYRILWGPNPVPGVTGGGGGGHPIEVSEGSTGGTSGSETSTGTQSQYYGVIVYANTKYNAALLTLGYDPNDSRFTDEIKVKLKISKYGGAFTDFAQSFDDLEGSDGKTQIPQFYDSDYTNRIMIYGVCASATSLYGAQNVWSNLYTESEAGLAKLAVELLLSGGSGGDGGEGSGGLVDDGAYMELHIPKLNSVWGYDMDPFVLRIKKGTSMYNAILNTDRTSKTVSICVHPTANNSGRVNVTLYVLPSTLTIETVDKGANKYIRTSTSTSLSMSVYYVNGNLPLDTSGTYNAVVDSNNNTTGNRSGRFILTADGFTQGNINYNWDSLVSAAGMKAYVDWAWVDIPADGINTDVVPDPEDPDPDPEPDPVTPRPDLPTPDPPVLPDPPDDPVVPDPPTLPDPKNPITPTTPTPDVDTGTYTPDLSGILDAMTQHCQHLQAKMVECSEYQAQYFEYVMNGFQDNLFSYLQGAVDYIVGALGGITTEGDYTQVGNWISWLGETIHADFGYLLDYLEALWSWLKDSLVIDFTGVGTAYDDSSLIGWLEKIYLKMGEGFNFVPTDPVTNPGDTGSWLDQFLGSFFGSLLGNLAGVLADAAGALGTLATKFPFCIPWDIMAILGLLASPPVCPVITLPCYSLTSSGLQEVGSYVIDLHDIEFAVEGIRWMMKLGFILVLANRTKDWLEMLEGVMG